MITILDITILASTNTTRRLSTAKSLDVDYSIEFPASVDATKVDTISASIAGSSTSTTFASSAATSASIAAWTAIAAAVAAR